MKYLILLTILLTGCIDVVQPDTMALTKHSKSDYQGIWENGSNTLQITPDHYIINSDTVVVYEQMSVYNPDYSIRLIKIISDDTIVLKKSGENLLMNVNFNGNVVLKKQ